MNFQTEDLNAATIAQEEPVRTTDLTLLSAPSGGGIDWSEPMSVQASVRDDGRVYGITILSGAKTPAAKRWINNLLYPAQFLPATRLGKPVNSTTNLIFINVRS